MVNACLSGCWAHVWVDAECVCEWMASVFEQKLWFSYEPERALGHQAKTQRTKGDENERAIAVLQKLKYAKIEICIKKDALKYV